MPTEVADSPAAEEGSAIHRAIAMGDFSKLNSDARVVAQQCVDFGERAILERGGDPINAHHEVGVTIPGVGKGTADFVAMIPDNDALVIDWKTGRVPSGLDVRRDPQIWAYAVGVWEATNATRIHACRFHPRVWDETREQWALFEGDRMPYQIALHRIVERSKPESPAVAGEIQCRFCRAKAACREFATWVGETYQEMALVPVNEALPAARLGEILTYRERLKLANRAMEIVEEQAKAAIRAGHEVVSPDGTRWELKPGATVRTLSDYDTARRLLEQIIPSDGLNAASKFSITELEKVWRLATGQKGKTAKDGLEAALHGALELVQRGESLVAMKGETT